jgi:hypothetical protein
MRLRQHIQHLGLQPPATQEKPKKTQEKPKKTQGKPTETHGNPPKPARLGATPFRLCAKWHTLQAVQAVPPTDAKIEERTGLPLK